MSYRLGISSVSTLMRWMEQQQQQWWMFWCCERIWCCVFAFCIATYTSVAILRNFKKPVVCSVSKNWRGVCLRARLAVWRICARLRVEKTGGPLPVPLPVQYRVMDVLYETTLELWFEQETGFCGYFLFWLLDAQRRLEASVLRENLLLWIVVEAEPTTL